jgi:hypothetical protein
MRCSPRISFLIPKCDGETMILRIHKPNHKMLAPGKQSWGRRDDAESNQKRCPSVYIVNLCHLGIPPWHNLLHHISSSSPLQGLFTASPFRRRHNCPSLRSHFLSCQFHPLGLFAWEQTGVRGNVSTRLWEFESISLSEDWFYMEIKRRSLDSTTFDCESKRILRSIALWRRRCSREITSFQRPTYLSDKSGRCYLPFGNLPKLPANRQILPIH